MYVCTCTCIHIDLLFIYAYINISIYTYLYMYFFNHCYVYVIIFIVCEFYMNMYVGVHICFVSHSLIYMYSVYLDGTVLVYTCTHEHVLRLMEYIRME